MKVTRAALTYARRYALFTLVGIAGEDDLDAPDLATPTNQTSGSENQSGTGNGRLNGGHNIAVRRAGNSKAVKQALAPEASAELRDQLLAELNNLGSADDAAMWAHRSLGEKNRLTPPDAQRVEEAFQKQLERGRSQRGYDIATENRPSHGIHPPELPRNQKHGLASIGDRFHGPRPLYPACRA